MDLLSCLPSLAVDIIIFFRPSGNEPAAAQVRAAHANTPFQGSCCGVHLA